MLTKKLAERIRVVSEDPSYATRFRFVAHPTRASEQMYVRVIRASPADKELVTWYSNSDKTYNSVPISSARTDTDFFDYLTGAMKAQSVHSEAFLQEVQTAQVQEAILERFVAYNVFLAALSPQKKVSEVIRHASNAANLLYRPQTRLDRICLEGRSFSTPKHLFSRTG
ncbi:MAG: hypothetical protein ACMXYD_02795 [Candidatus Woesearchaeota archaeon]